MAMNVAPTINTPPANESTVKMLKIIIAVILIIIIIAIILMAYSFYVVSKGIGDFIKNPLGDWKPGDNVNKLGKNFENWVTDGWGYQKKDTTKYKVNGKLVDKETYDISVIEYEKDLSQHETIIGSGPTYQCVLIRNGKELTHKNSESWTALKLWAFGMKADINYQGATAFIKDSNGAKALGIY
jgi:hypothetical protein